MAKSKQKAKKLSKSAEKEFAFKAERIKTKLLAEFISELDRLSNSHQDIYVYHDGEVPIKAYSTQEAALAYAKKLWPSATLVEEDGIISIGVFAMVYRAPVLHGVAK